MSAASTVVTPVVLATKESEAVLARAYRRRGRRIGDAHKALPDGLVGHAGHIGSCAAYGTSDRPGSVLATPTGDGSTAGFVERVTAVLANVLSRREQ